MAELMVRYDDLRRYCEKQHCESVPIEYIKQMPTIEAEPVRRGKGCSYCKGRSYTKKPLTVITRTMKHVEVCFNFCPNCGVQMDRGANNDSR